MIDVLFFHAGLRFELAWHQSRMKMAVIILLMFNLFFIYFSSYIGFESFIIREVAIILFSTYVLV